MLCDGSSPCRVWIAAIAFGVVGCRTVPASHRAPVPTRALESLPPDLRARVQRERQQLDVRLSKQQSDFAASQERRLQLVNEANARRIVEIERAGGPASALSASLRDLRAAVAAASAADRARMEREGLGRQESALEASIRNIAFCATPFVFTEEQGSTVLTIEPRAALHVVGCHLGSRAGEVSLVLSSAPGAPLPLTVTSWSDQIIGARLPPVSGQIDQPAQLVVTLPDGTRLAPLDVQFQATRAMANVDPVAHPGVLYADCGDRTSDDSCVALAVAGPPRTLFAAASGHHMQVCCASETETDRYVFALKNGWKPAFLWVPGGPTAPEPEGPQPYYGFAADGLTQFSWSNEGKITGYEQRAGDPRFQGEVDITWWVDWSGSGIVYIANFQIVGPAGVPYW